MNKNQLHELYLNNLKNLLHMDNNENDKKNIRKLLHELYLNHLETLHLRHQLMYIFKNKYTDKLFHEALEINMNRYIYNYKTLKQTTNFIIDEYL